MNHRAIRRMLAATTVAAFVVGAAACSSSGTGGKASGSTHTSAKPTTSGSASDSSGKEISIGIPNPPTSLDPQIGTAGGDYPILYMMYDRLLDSDPKTGQPEPGLAESWEYTDDAKTKLKLTLRTGVKFQDGTPLDAEAVAASLERYKSMGVQSDLNDMQSVDVVNDHVVVLNMGHTNSALPAILSDRAGMIVSPTAVKKYGKDYAAHPAGTGPYMLKSQESGSQITLSAFNDYWNGEPKLSDVRWVIASNPTTLENSIRSGQVDMILRYPAKDAVALKKDASLTVSADPSLAFMRIYLDTSHKPFNDNRVRQAFNYAINRDNLVKVVNGGIGEPATGPLPLDNPYLGEDAEPTWTYDPAKAKALLADAGLADGVSITCLSSHGQGYDAASPLLVADLKAVGITMNIKEESLAQQHVDFPASKSDCSFSSWTGRADPYMTIQGLYASDGTYNYFHTDLGLDPLIAKLQSTHEEAARASVIQEIVAGLRDAAPGVPLISQPSMVAYNNSVKGYVPNIVGKPDLRSVYVGS